jgi:sulfate permease, SulP family
VASPTRSSGHRERIPFAPNVTAAALCAVVTLAYAGSFGQLVFGGALAPYVGQAILAALVSSVAVTLMLSWRSSFRFVIGGPDANPSAILAVTAAGLAADLTSSTTSTEELLATVLLFIAISAVGCGLVLYLLGERRWGRYVRYIPFPVVAGFLAGTGFLLVTGSYRMLTGLRFGSDAWSQVSGLHPLASVTVAVVATVLFVLSRWLRHYLVLPTVIFVAVLLFHAARALMGVSLAEARELGLLLPALELGEWRNAAMLNYDAVRWDAVVLHVRDFAALLVVVVITTLLNVTSLEHATDRDGDSNQELRALGVGNIVAGLAGGMVATHSFNRSVLNLRAGATSRWAACMSALMIVLVIGLAPAGVGLLPRPVLTGLILFLGLGLLTTWAIDSRRTMPGTDYTVVLAILVIIAVFGVTPGVMLGAVIACVSLAFTLSRSPTIRSMFTAKTRRANVERTPEQLASLADQGGALRGFVLQGVLFFGTTSRVLETIRRLLQQTRIVLLDFRLVQGVDGSSTMVLKRLHTICRDAGVQLVLTGLPTSVEQLLRRAGFALDAPHVRRFADLDRGLEWCEDYLLNELTALGPLTDPLRTALTPGDVQILFEAFEQRTLAAGSIIVTQGSASDEMFMVLRGRVHVLLPVQGQGPSAFAKRLRTYGAGTIVGEMSFYSDEPRSADLMAEEETHVLCITRERLAVLEREQPAFALRFHRHVIRTLSHRLRAANDEIRQLL